MILIGLGANLPTPEYGLPRATLGAALETISAHGISIDKRAPWYKSAPVPVSDQPWYVNGVCEIVTDLSAQKVVDCLLGVEQQFGRQRSVQNAARILDLDLLVYNDLVVTGRDPSELSVPHPRMSERAFVLLPLNDIAPNWCDPVSGKTITELIKKLPENQQTVGMPDANGLYGTEWPGTKTI